MDQMMRLDKPEGPTTETEEPVPAVPENLVTDSRHLKVAGILLQKIDD